MQEVEIVLASASPRRQELIALTGWEVRIAAEEVDERRRQDEGPRDMTRRLAFAKAKAAGGKSGLILGADTVVVDGEQLLGKPMDLGDARQMLEALSGRSHQVVTSIALLDLNSGTHVVDTCESRVPMRRFNNADLDSYLASGNPLDKAGSYAIQDKEFMPVDAARMKDCFANVMGLPLCHVVRNLPQAPPVDVPAACQAHTGYECPIYSEVLEGNL
ncbi:MAG: Maf family nucleotide pyrophosphatase [Anaerolineae bacterium]|nr:MAG: Maf family nucleotide pyrophosphatase [Anaerolineae bacterium]